uniref:Uncharacterized protein n=1 Tax=Utricularia reniformis TaxID=192314 RepID=A0A1Y0B169_9LAMI|nr:hypothetical protein AEK19_MT0973 [Utricularia reniformis]ART31196.1 hypothetical protein AEK19_MT0973 [Utricularia reniformis]
MRRPTRRRNRSGSEMGAPVSADNFNPGFNLLRLPSWSACSTVAW